MRAVLGAGVLTLFLGEEAGRMAFRLGESEPAYAHMPAGADRQRA